MSYSLLTYSPNEILTSAKMNQASDNDEALRDGSAFNNDIILEQHILDGEVTDGKWRNGVAFSAYLSATYAMPTASSAKVICDLEDYDLGADYNPTLGRFVAPYNGVYHFDGSWRTDEAGRQITLCYVNGSEYKRVNDGTAAADRNIQFSYDLQLSAGDYVEFWAFVTAAASVVKPSPGTRATHFSGHMVTRI